MKSGLNAKVGCNHGYFAKLIYLFNSMLDWLSLDFGAQMTVSLSPKELRGIYGRRDLLPAYILYLHKVDPDLWTPKALAVEYDTNHQHIAHIINGHRINKKLWL